MRAREVQVGDYFPDPTPGIPSPAYVIEEIVDVVPSHVKVRVRYRDGGDGLRAWEPEDEVPLKRGPGGLAATEWKP